ncbi:MAG: 6-carboxytetrahydropterin synthase [Acidobacteriaceae bacterium]|nr:6-carboxytetrahydropterin synthase [Acidobacteriaceae bacterium]MBV8569209.1 6-carboxytetrahydropterin synthase [Acidobacteriaceae bacterium]
MTTLTRRYQFSASHRLHSPELTPGENALVYGKCNNPYGHGHNYLLEITVEGPVDSGTGLIVRVAGLDRLVQSTILSRFAHRNMNADIPELAGVVPTTENVLHLIANLLRNDWHRLQGPPHPRLHRVHLQETERNGFELLVPAVHSKSPLEFKPESVSVNV